MKLILNSNDKVKVTLTEKGVSIYKRYCKTWDIGSQVDFSVRERTFTLWELMQVFGPYMGIGLEVPFENNVMEVL